MVFSSKICSRFFAIKLFLFKNICTYIRTQIIIITSLFNQKVVWFLFENFIFKSCKNIFTTITMEWLRYSDLVWFGDLYFFLCTCIIGPIAYIFYIWYNTAVRVTFVCIRIQYKYFIIATNHNAYFYCFVVII